MKQILSLKDIKLPVCWETKPNKTEYMDFVYQESLEMEVWRKDNEIDILTHHHVTDLSRFFWPNANFEGLVLGAELMVWFFAFDDLFDGGFIDDNENEQSRLVNRMNNVFMEGTIETDSTGAERMGYHIRNKVKSICGEKRQSTFLRFNSSCVQWIDSIIPFIKLKKNQISLDFNLYLYHRKYNIGAIPCFIISEIILDPMSTIDSFIWSDSRWIKMSEITCEIIALVNDCASYEKEIKENGAPLNPLKFIQIEKNFNLQESYEHISNYLNKIIKQYIELELSFINSYKLSTKTTTTTTTTINDDDDDDDDINSDRNINFTSIVNHLHNMSFANVSWSTQTPRYLSQTQPFIELRRNTKIVTKICNIKK
ncbi:hypothetical protein RB653_010347 [Dictyostelium firmibasis]|uniref:Terpene synthase n=1 Tax=Dictyostelium firmibasis TaxID=79012 RepID=A0AAN7YPP9_9MYCE